MYLQELDPSNIIHVYPVGDLKLHWVDEGDMDTCPCGPAVEYEGASAIVVHNAWDNREIIEQAKEVLGIF